jgi:DNA-binding transcriptional regulator LsrR (DeoR family)
MENRSGYSEQNRIVAKILHLYYLENCSQIEIARHLGLSATKINRLIKTARQSGMVEINIRLPFVNLFDLESRMLSVSNLRDVIITPSMDNSPEGDLSQLVQIAASYLVSQVQPKDAICIGGGRTVTEIINHVQSHKITGIRIYPAIGGVQHNSNLDVNSCATRLAQKLDGEAVQFYAPAFAETETERDTVFGLTHVARALEYARSARIGLFGIGDLDIGSSIVQYCPLPYSELAELVKLNSAVGEMLGLAFDSQGCGCIPEVNGRSIGISLDDIHRLPIRIGAAVGAKKARAIAAAVRGGYFTSLILDENAARLVLSILEEEPVPNLRRSTQA